MKLRGRWWCGRNLGSVSSFIHTQILKRDKVEKGGKWNSPPPTPPLLPRHLHPLRQSSSSPANSGESYIFSSLSLIFKVINKVSPIFFRSKKFPNLPIFIPVTILSRVFSLLVMYLDEEILYFFSTLFFHVKMDI